VHPACKKLSGGEVEICIWVILKSAISAHSAIDGPCAFVLVSIHIAVNTPGT